MEDDLENLMGPELTVTFANLKPDQLAALTKKIGYRDNNSDLAEQFVAAFAPPLCSAVDDYIKRDATVTERIKVEPEFEPNALVEDSDVVIMLNINVFFTHANDKLKRVLCSSKFEKFLIHETSNVIMKALQPELSWLNPQAFSVAIDGFGEGEEESHAQPIPKRTKGTVRILGASGRELSSEIESRTSVAHAMEESRTRLAQRKRTEFRIV